VALFRWRSFVSLSLLIFLPLSLFAQDSRAQAILRSSGGVLVNTSAAPKSVALFLGDEIETRATASARIEYSGSSIEISPESIIKVESGEIVLEHGSVVVTTFRQFRVRSGCVLATPMGTDETVYTVTKAKHPSESLCTREGCEPRFAFRPETQESARIFRTRDRASE